MLRRVFFREIVKELIQLAVFGVIIVFKLQIAHQFKNGVHRALFGFRILQYREKQRL